MSSSKESSEQKWGTLIHTGVLFPPFYEPVPSSIKIKYNGVPIKLDAKNTNNPFNISSEEGAMFLAMKMEQDDRLAEKDSKRKKSMDDKVFVKNFWNDWKIILKSGKQETQIIDFSKVDFTPFQKYIAKRSEEKKSIKKNTPKEKKLEEKEEKEEVKKEYGYAIVDGVQIAIGGYMVQPPGLYLGHGQHPVRGKIKKRISPSDVTLNISKKHVPKCTNNGIPCKWGAIEENKTVTWIACYRNPITEEMNYVWLKRDESHWVKQDDQLKFEKARKLHKSIKSIREIYMKDLQSNDKETRQFATAVYLLDVLAIRPGVEKDESKEANTLGLTTLKCENIEFRDDLDITIDFIGKSSIPFIKTFKINKYAYANLKNTCKETRKGVKLFPDINATSLNAYLKKLLPDLTAKVFRTYKASSILQNILDKNVPDIDVETYEKKLIYNKANIEVAKELNHKKLGTNDQSLEKLKQKIKNLKTNMKEATTDKKKATIKKSIELNKTKLEEIENNISTSTSKVNYLDPRITVSWCKKAEMPIEKIYNKTSLNKFIWAMSTKPGWKF